jgi:3-oxoadipate enol-lactonase
MPTIRANGITLAYEQQGDGPDLVLITGVGYGMWFWRYVRPGLARRFRVTTFDNRGAGASAKPAGPYTVDMMANDTAALMDALALRDAAVLGHSLGGYIAQRLIYRRPELVGRLILASVNYGGQKVVPITAEAYEVLTNRQGDPAELLARGLKVAAAPGFGQRRPEIWQELVAYRLTNPVPPAQFSAQVMAGVATAFWSDADVDRHMSAIRVPTLILFGEHDQVVPPANADLMAAKIAGARVQILPGTGHIFPVEAPAATIEAISGFLTVIPDKVTR